MTFDELLRAFLDCNPLGKMWVAGDDNICMQAHSTAPTEIFSGTHDDIARHLNLCSKNATENATENVTR